MNNQSSSVILPNVHEFMCRGMDQSFPETLLSEWRDIGAGFSEAAMFWEGDDKLILSPKPVDGEFIAYIKDLAGYHDISIAVPQNFSSNTCDDILQDEAVMETVARYVKPRNEVFFLPWGATEGVYRLLDEFSQRNLRLISQELPSVNHYWTSLYYDSKVGFKEFCTQLQKEHHQIHIPQGFTCDSLPEAMEIIKWYHGKGRACVLKASSGAGGFGNVFIKEGLLHQTFQQVVEYVKETIEELPYFKSGAIIVEEFVEVRAAESRVPCSSCFMSGFILPDGNMKIVAAGVDMKDNYNYYAGARLGKDVLPPELQLTLETIMLKLGEGIAQNGYRGQWGVNFMIASGDTPVLIELNARRCGESHVHGLAKRLFGGNWMSESLVITRFPLNVEIRRSFSMKDLLGVFEECNREFKGKNTMVAPTQLSWLWKKRFPGIGYLVIGPELETVERAEHSVLEKLAKIGIHPE